MKRETHVKVLYAYLREVDKDKAVSILQGLGDCDPIQVAQEFVLEISDHDLNNIASIVLNAGYLDNV